MNTHRIAFDNIVYNKKFLDKEINFPRASVALIRPTRKKLMKVVPN